MFYSESTYITWQAHHLIVVEDNHSRNNFGEFHLRFAFCLRFTLINNFVHILIQMNRFVFVKHVVLSCQAQHLKVPFVLVLARSRYYLFLYIIIFPFCCYLSLIRNICFIIRIKEDNEE